MTESDAAPTAAGVEHCYRHPDRETRIHCTRCDRPICPDCMIPAAVGFQCPEDVKAGNKDVRQARTPFGGRASAATPVTITLLVANIGVFLATAAGGTSLGTSGGTSRLYRDWSLVPYIVSSQHEYQRFFTSMFLHYGLVHVALNMFALYQLGPILERILGATRFAVLYLLAGLGGSVATYLFAGSLTASAGASGAIFGLFAAYFVIAKRINADASQILVTIGINLAFTFAVPNISKTGHIGGLVVGGLVAAVLAYAPRGSRQLPLQIAGVGAVVAVMAVVTFTHTASLPDGLVRCGSAICISGP